MRLTHFRKLRRAVEAIDPNLVGKKLATLEKNLTQKGIEFNPTCTAFTHEGIFYIDPESGIATKVVLYEDQTALSLSRAQQKSLPTHGIEDRKSIEQFHRYHLMRCSAFGEAQKSGWQNQNFRISKRMNGEFYYRIVSEPHRKTGVVTTYKEFDQQKLLICNNCLWKASCLIQGANGVTADDFNLQTFFDIDAIQGWNSEGMLSKDYGLTRNWHPEDWQEICRIRLLQVEHRCEHCDEHFSTERLQRFLKIQAIDHFMGREGFFKLEAVCVVCRMEQENQHTLELESERKEYERVRGSGRRS